MNNRCPTAFEQEKISGYLDGELPQGQEQRVRLHLEGCRHCRELLEQLSELREVTMTTRFAAPGDQQWDERAQGVVSSGARRLGWIIFISWLIALTGLGLWTAWQAPESLLERLLVIGGLSGLGLLFLSVLLDRIRNARTDRYREVQR